VEKQVAYRFAIAAGGTGGHVIPGLEVAAELRRRGHECVMVGTERGMEARLAPKAGFELETIHVGALNRVSLARKLRTLAELPRSLWEARAILLKHRPAAVLSLGGYASGPLTLAAVLSGLPVIAMEPNAYPGLANRLAARWVRRALLGFDDAMRYFPSGRTEVVGVPIRQEFFDLPRKDHVGPATVLITGGSQGSRTLNRATVEAVKFWSEKGFPGGIRVIHQTGQPQYNEIRAEYDVLRKTREVSLEAVPFLDDMPAAFARADLVVSRAGASALAELAASGKASILVPFPFAADDALELGSNYIDHNFDRYAWPVGNLRRWDVIETVLHDCDQPRIVVIGKDGRHMRERFEDAGWPVFYQTLRVTAYGPGCTPPESPVE